MQGLLLDCTCPLFNKNLQIAQQNIKISRTADLEATFSNISRKFVPNSVMYSVEGCFY